MFKFLSELYLLQKILAMTMLNDGGEIVVHLRNTCSLVKCRNGAARREARGLEEYQAQDGLL